MPSPNFFDWCSVSISSIQKSVHQIINTCTKSEFEISPYIAGIQSLNGKTSGEKYKDLNITVKTIVANTKQTGEVLSIDGCKEISPAMLNLIKILVGRRLPIQEIIIQGLKSNDIDINRKALKADWFFHGSNDFINAENFINNIMLFVSVNMRHKIIKKLSYSLNGFEKKAEEFFNSLVELYGYELALPILAVCSPDFIYKKILKYSIKIPVKEIARLFKNHPNTVIQYLQLGNKKNKTNEKERDIIDVKIHDYDSFIPKLIQNYPKEFIDLYEITPEKTLKLGNKLTDSFMNHLKHELLDKPNIYLKLLSPNIVKRYIDDASFKQMIRQLFPTDENHINFDNILQYFKYYKHIDVVCFLKNQYDEVYNKKLLDNKLYLESRQLLQMIGNEEKEESIKTLLRKHKNNNDFKNLYKYYFPPQKVIKFLQTKILQSTNSEERAIMLGHMIISCRIYNNKDQLLNVLHYYYNNHRNDQNLVFTRFFHCLSQEFDLKSLDSDCWAVINQIICHAYVKKELFISYISLVEFILEASLLNSLKYSRDNDELLTKIFNIIVECKMEFSASDSNILIDTEFEREYLVKFFEQVPIKYPELHEVWKMKFDRLTLALRFLKMIDNYNKRNGCVKITKKSRKKVAIDDNVMEKKINIENFSWIVKLSEEFFESIDQTFSIKRKKLLDCIKRNSPNLYEDLLDKYIKVRSIETGEALLLLKKNPKKILDNWNDYLLEARKKLCLGNKAARRFIHATKWYHDIPVKFIEKSLFELHEEGSLYVLAILLEGKVFEKYIQPYVPTNGKIDVNSKDAETNFEITKNIIRAFRYTNTTISFSILASFCKGDYAQLTEDMMMKIAHYAPAHMAFEFATQFIDSESAMKNKAYLLIEKVATKPQMKDFLEDRLKNEKTQSARQLIAKMTFSLFTKSPNLENWKLMNNCINTLSVDDQRIMEIFSDLRKVDVGFLAIYIKTYMQKIEDNFNKIESYCNNNAKIRCILLFIENLDLRIMNVIPEELSESIVKKFFYYIDSIQISNAAQYFTVRLYLLQSDKKLERRLKIITDILKNVIDNFNKPHPRKPRFYPANYIIHQFFNYLLLEISCKSIDIQLEIVESMLKVLNSTLSKWEATTSRFSLSLYKEYLLAESPLDFGIRIAKRIFDILVEFLKSEALIEEITACLKDLIDNKIYKDFKNPQLKLTIIDGILSEDNYYGNLVAINLLDNNIVNTYDERYDHIIKNLQKKQQIIIKCRLFHHINMISEPWDDV